MEALVALGLACNVMQLIEFSVGLISVARHAYEVGSVEDDLSDQVSRLIDLSTAMKESLMSSTSNPATQEQNAVEQAAQECLQASVQLQGEIKALCP